MLIDLPADMDVYRLKYDSHCREQWESYLSAAERDQMNRFGSRKRRREFLLGRAVLRELLARHLDRPPADIPVYQADDGAPEVEGSPVQVSLTHSHGWAAAVVGSGPIGIDMEYIQPRHERLYQQILHDREMEMFDALPCDHDERQILCWTLKEATLKAVRPTERLSLRDMWIDCRFEARQAVVHVANLSLDWTVMFEKLDNFYLAVAYPSADSVGSGKFQVESSKHQ